MVHLQNGIFCKKLVRDMAKGSAKKVTHLARRLMEGVFKDDAIRRCTFTGQTPRAQGKLRQMENIISLDEKAKSAIIGKKHSKIMISFNF